MGEDRVGGSCCPVGGIRRRALAENLSARLSELCEAPQSREFSGSPHRNQVPPGPGADQLARIGDKAPPAKSRVVRIGRIPLRNENLIPLRDKQVRKRAKATIPDIPQTFDLTIERNISTDYTNGILGSKCWSATLGAGEGPMIQRPFVIFGLLAYVIAAACALLLESSFLPWQLLVALWVFWLVLVVLCIRSAPPPKRKAIWVLGSAVLLPKTTLSIILWLGWSISGFAP